MKQAGVKMLHLHYKRYLKFREKKINSTIMKYNFVKFLVIKGRNPLYNLNKLKITFSKLRGFWWHYNRIQL